MVNERRLARWCRRELRALEIEPPLSLEVLGARISRRRGKIMRLQPHSLDAGIFGLWLSLPEIDLVLYQAETTPAHQRDIVLHEFGHILAGHVGSGSDAATPADLLPRLPRSVVATALRRTCCDDTHEREAELAATIIADWAERSDIVTPSRSTGRTRWIDRALNDEIGWA